MERVYEPDWTTDDAGRLHLRVADVLAEIAPDDVRPSIQTAPLAFAPNVHGPADVARFTTQLLRVVAHLAALEARTGRRVTLALEPEPACYLETTDETVRYFAERIHTRRRRRPSSPRLAGVPLSEAAGAAAPAPRGGVRHRPPVGRASRTSPRRSGSWSPPASRSSSCRRRPRCG